MIKNTDIKKELAKKLSDKQLYGNDNRVSYSTKKKEFFKDYDVYKKIKRNSFAVPIVVLLILGVLVSCLSEVTPPRYDNLLTFIVFLIWTTGVIAGFAGMYMNHKRAYWATTFAYGNFSEYNSAIQEAQVNAIKNQNSTAARQMAMSKYEVGSFSKNTDARLRINQESLANEQMLNNLSMGEFNRIRNTNYVQRELVELVNEIRRTSVDKMDCAREIYVINEEYDRRLF